MDHKQRTRTKNVIHHTASPLLLVPLRWSLLLLLPLPLWDCLPLASRALPSSLHHATNGGREGAAVASSNAVNITRRRRQEGEEEEEDAPQLLPLLLRRPRPPPHNPHCPPVSPRCDLRLLQCKWHERCGATDDDGGGGLKMRR